MALLDDLRREVRQRGERIARAAAVTLEGQLRNDSPSGLTGQLERRTTVRITNVGDVIEAIAVVDVPYAEPVILGSRAHRITTRPPDRPARTGQVGSRGMLRFPGNGGVFIFRKEVWHPGTKPAPYWRRHMNRWGVYLQQAADRLR